MKLNIREMRIPNDNVQKYYVTPLMIMLLTCITPTLQAATVNIETITFSLQIPADTVTEAPVMPAFKNGGHEAFLRFIGKNIKYPARARRNDIQGTVLVSFVINTLGKVVDVRIVEGIGFDCDKEVIRLISSMPDWNPGRLEDNTPIAVRIVHPVKFRMVT